MLLFAISFILVFASSYLITSIIEPRKNILGLIYLFVVAFSQIVLTFEVLSLFSLIKQYWVLGFNVIFFATSLFIWNKKARPLWSLSCESFINRTINSFKLDKSLIVLFLGFLVFITSALILCTIMPMTNGDARSYHVVRSLFWVLQGNLNHFEIADIRNLCLPINSEIIYAWILLFIKKDIFLSFCSFVGYVLSIVSLYNILGFMGYCTRKRLWVIFILSSLSSVIVQASGTETDIIISGLILSCIFLFWYALKTGEKTPIFMASLAYALAIGTKTTSLIMIPGVGLFMLALCFHFKKYKPILPFLGFGVINFLIFSSFNYILNYLQFANFMGSENFIVVSKNYYGIKGLFANFIKYIFMFFDFTGFRWSDYLGNDLSALRTSILTFFHLNHVPDGLYTASNNFQRTLLEPLMGAGILGFLVYLPCLLWATVKPIFKFRSKKNRLNFAFAILFFVNLVTISYVLAYMAFSVRFIMSFLVLSSPVLIYSYLSKKNPLKYVIIFFSLFYLIFVSTSLWARPLSKIVKILIKKPSITYLRYISACKDFQPVPQLSDGACVLRNKIKANFTPDNKILAFISTGDSVYYIKTLNFEGYNIDIRRMEDASGVDFSKYNVIITTNEGQEATFITDYDERKNDYEFKNNDLIQHKKREIPCMYKYNVNIPKITNGKQNAPYQSVCILNKELVKKQNLQVIGTTGVIKPLQHEYNYYIILQNTKFPPKFKKAKKTKKLTKRRKVTLYHKYLRNE